MNHPHIGAIYGVEPFEGARALILEWSRARRSNKRSGVARG